MPIKQRREQSRQTHLLTVLELEGHKPVEAPAPTAPPEAPKNLIKPYFANPDDAMPALAVVWDAITLPPSSQTLTASIPQNCMAVIEAAAQFNKFKKATTYRDFSRADAQNLACYLAASKALELDKDDVLNHWRQSIGKGHGGRSFPCSTIINLRTVRGTNPRYRWYPNRQNQQIEAFLFASLEETHSGHGTVSIEGWCYRWQLGPVQYEKDKNGKEFLLLNTARLKSEGLLQKPQALAVTLQSKGGC